MYDVEIQRQDAGADVHRARFHSSVLDTRMLNAQQEFKESYTADERNTYDIEKALKPKRPKLKANDKYLVIDADALEL